MKEDKKLSRLIEFCGYGLYEPAKELIEQGVDINGLCHNMTPLLAAIYGRDIELIEFLIDCGANINTETDFVLYEAFDCLLINMIEEGLDKPNFEELEIIKLLVDKGAEVDRQNEIGESPLDLINKYVDNIESFERIKSFFRPIIPDIDNKVEFKIKHKL
jgi:ankyrin repeat protein